jgi:hypothetical protein
VSKYRKEDAGYQPPLKLLKRARLQQRRHDLLGGLIHERTLTWMTNRHPQAVADQLVKRFILSAYGGLP